MATAFDRERVRAALARDGERVLRYGAPCFAVVMAIEAIDHGARGLDVLTVYHSLFAPFLALLGIFAWRRPDRLRPVWPWLLIAWLVPFGSVSLHFASAPLMSMVFMSMGVLTAAALIMPTPAIAVALPLTWASQAGHAFAVFPDDPYRAALVPTFTLAVALLLHWTRRSALIHAERERVLEQAIRIQQQKLAEIGTLAAGIAHQINNPVGTILTSADFALLSEDEPEAIRIMARALADIRAEALRCGRIVRSVLKLSRDEVAERWSCDPIAALGSALHATADYGRERDAKVETVVDPNLEDRTLQANPIELEQVFVNLIRNALETKPLGACVRVAARCAEDAAGLAGGGSVEIVVEDDGPGVAAQNVDAIFEPFFTRRADAGGMGLGLSLAREIVVANGGRIELDVASSRRPSASRLSGARFVVRLPLEVAPEAAPKPRLSPN